MKGNIVLAAIGLLVLLGIGLYITTILKGGEQSVATSPSVTNTEKAPIDRNGAQKSISPSSSAPTSASPETTPSSSDRVLWISDITLAVKEVRVLDSDGNGKKEIILIGGSRYVYSLEDGKIKWKYGPLKGYYIGMCLDAGGGKVYVGDLEHVRIIDASTGKLLDMVKFRRTYPCPFYTPGGLYVHANGNVYRLEGNSPVLVEENFGIVSRPFSELGHYLFVSDYYILEVYPELRKMETGGKPVPFGDPDVAIYRGTKDYIVTLEQKRGNLLAPVSVVFYSDSGRKVLYSSKDVDRLFGYNGKVYVLELRSLIPYILEVTPNGRKVLYKLNFLPWDIVYGTCFVGANDNKVLFGGSCKGKVQLPFNVLGVMALKEDVSGDGVPDVLAWGYGKIAVISAP